MRTVFASKISYCSSREARRSFDRFVMSEKDATAALKVVKETPDGICDEDSEMYAAGLMAATGDKSGAELEEERRLFYVGITRAKDELYITSCATRRLYGRTEFMEPSVFLQEAGAGIFKVLGNVPPRYQRAMENSGAGDNDEWSNDKWLENEWGEGIAGHEHFDDPPQYAAPQNSVPKINHPLAKKYGLGQGIYHDDYGEGQVVKAYMKDDEYVIEVQFQNGGPKKFLPAYQGSQLMRISE